MKRVIKATDDLILKRCNDHIANIEDTLAYAKEKEAEYIKYKKSEDFDEALNATNGAFYNLNDYSRYLSKLIKADRLTPQEQEYFNTVYDESYDEMNSSYERFRSLKNK